MRTSPLSLLRSPRMKVRPRPTPTAGSAKAAMFTLKPRSDTIHAVTVVPMLAPITMPMA